MRFKRLTKETELEQYRDGFLSTIQKKSSNIEKSTMSELPLSYLKESLVIGVFNQENLLVAGYTLGTKTPLRLLSFVPENKRESLVVPFDANWNDCCEITCAWKTPEVSLLFMSSRLWPLALIGVLKSGKRILLGHNQSARLDRFYTALGPATIYSGVSSYGLTSRLFAYNRWRIVLCVLGLWLFETPRRFLKGEK